MSIDKIWQNKLWDVNNIIISDSGLYKAGVLHDQLVPVQTWQWEVLARQHWSIPLHSCGLCSGKHQQQKWNHDHRMEWWGAVQVTEWPEKSVSNIHNALKTIFAQMNSHPFVIYFLKLLLNSWTELNWFFLIEILHWRPCCLLEDWSMVSVRKWNTIFLWHNMTLKYKVNL